jgi:hypothetical protein
MELDEFEIPKSRRPKRVKDIDPEIVYRLACLQCTSREIADVVGVSHNTICKKFGDLIEKGQNVGRKSLRRAQFEKALGGSDRMLVWLGKQYLGQKETPDNGDDTTPLPWED